MSEALLFSTDAREWANEFVKIFGGDVDLMTTWFASAIETGRGAGILQGSAMIREQVQAAMDEMTNKALACTPPVGAKTQKVNQMDIVKSICFCCDVVAKHTGVVASEEPHE